VRKLGIIANYMPNYSLKPWIDTVAEGLVADWNKAGGFGGSGDF
jgi:hypothetical protein